MFIAYGSGYKEEAEYQEFLSKMEELNIKVLSLHTSGHADYIALKQVIDSVNADYVFCIHTENQERN